MKRQRYTERRWPLDYSGRDSSDASTSQGRPKTATRYQARKDFPLQASDRTWPCCDFVLLASRTVSEYISVKSGLWYFVKAAAGNEYTGQCNKAIYLAFSDQSAQGTHKSSPA